MLNSRQENMETPAMARLTSRCSRLIPLWACAVLTGCAAAPADTADSEMRPAVVAEAEAEAPELTLNLPLMRAGEDCRCDEAPASEESRDLTFLERGYAALARGDHIEAVQYFQRYQRLETSPEAAWEAGMAIAYVSMLQASPFFDPDAARKSWRRLSKSYTSDMQVHYQSLLMRDSLETFLTLERHITDLEANNATLKEDLEKREEALKRLRELTLGQRGSKQ
jgi:tetratricopeptide (TPR) repeat protein